MSIIDRWRADLDEARVRSVRSTAAARRRIAAAEPASPLGPIASALGGALAGAAALYLLDPQHGRTRRAQLADRLRAALHSGRRQADRVARGVGATAAATVARTSATLGGTSTPDMNDAELAARVETELFADASVPKGALNVNAENGIVVIRGELPSSELQQQIEGAVRRIPGVWEVNNLTHLAGEPLPTAR